MDNWKDRNSTLGGVGEENWQTRVLGWKGTTTSWNASCFRDLFRTCLPDAYGAPRVSATLGQKMGKDNVLRWAPYPFQFKGALRNPQTDDSIKQNRIE